jgi:hypothetical protein
VRVKGWLVCERATGNATAGLAVAGSLESAAWFEADAGWADEPTGDDAACAGDGEAG